MLKDWSRPTYIILWAQATSRVGNRPRSITFLLRATASSGIGIGQGLHFFFFESRPLFRYRNSARPTSPLHWTQTSLGLGIGPGPKVFFFLP